MSVRVPYRHSGILYVEAIEVRASPYPFAHHCTMGLIRNSLSFQTIPEDLDEPQLIPEAFILDMSASKLDNRGLAKAISAAPSTLLPSLPAQISSRLTNHGDGGSL